MEKSKLKIETIDALMSKQLKITCKTTTIENTRTSGVSMV